MPELVASLLACLVLAALIHGVTGLIDNVNDQPISVSYQHHQES